MSNRTKVILLAISVLLTIIGFIFGLILNDIPNLSLNKEVKVYEIINVLLTIIFGISIPFLIKKWIDDNRYVKSALVEEIKNIISTIDKIKVIISSCHSSSSITKENKDQINYLFHEAELKINSLQEQLKISFSTQGTLIIDKLKTKFGTYKDFLTGGDLMISTFTNIDTRFYKEHNTEYSKIETHLKTVIHTIHKI